MHKYACFAMSRHEDETTQFVDDPIFLYKLYFRRLDSCFRFQ